MERPEHKNIVSPGQAFAERLKQVRARRGWTQAELSERLDAVGYPIDRVTLSKIERGGARASNVKLEEVLAIALVLGVSPKFMLAPYGQESRLRVVPGKQPSTPGIARGWIAGQWTLDDEDPGFFFTELPPEEIEEATARAREVEIGRPTTREAFFKRQAMADVGEAPPIIQEGEETP